MPFSDINDPGDHELTPDELEQRQEIFPDPDDEPPAPDPERLVIAPPEDE